MVFHLIGSIDPGNLSLKGVVQASSFHNFLWRLLKDLEEGSVRKTREALVLRSVFPQHLFVSLFFPPVSFGFFSVIVVVTNIVTN